ncbi:MAG: transglutaminase-like domain-containing protein [Rhodocyclaceae bacterium]
MRRYVVAAQREPHIYQLARTIVRHVPGKSHAGEAAAIYRWVQDHIAYRFDPVGHEAIQTPEQTLKLAAGDCDDHAILVAALGESLGLKSRFVVGGPAPGDYRHVWPELLAGGHWIPLDTTERRGPGWRPPLPYQMLAEARS